MFLINTWQGIYNCWEPSDNHGTILGIAVTYCGDFKTVMSIFSLTFVIWSLL